MKYYVDTIEQVRTENPGEYNEYGSRTIKPDYDSALTTFYTKLTNVSASTQHTWLDIKIVNSEGGCVEKDSIGQYVETNTQAPTE